MKNIRHARQRFRALSGRPGGTERPRWGFVFPFTFLGAGLLAAGYFASTYGQAVLVGLGSTLFLFSLLTYAGTRLVEQIGASLSLTSLADVQQALKAEFNRAAWDGVAANWDRGGSPAKPNGADLVDQRRLVIERTITEAGFLTERSDAKLMEFRDTGGLNIIWIINFDDTYLKQAVQSEYFNDNWTCLIGDRENEIHLRKSLIDFQNRVEFAMRGLALALARRHGGP